MSLTRQAALLLVGALWLAILASLGVHAVGMQRTLALQLEVRNRDDASLLALALSQQGGDETLMQTVASATFDLGHYRRLRLVGDDGRVRFDLGGGERLADAPGWLVAAMPIDAPPGTAQVTDGWRRLGQVELASHSAWAHEAMWQALQHTALLLLVLGALAGAAAMLALRAWQRPLEVTVAQAQALEEGRFVVADEPRAPELKRLTRSMNAMVRRLQQWFDAQAAQVDALQRLADTDAVTGLPNRRCFMARLAAGRDAAAAAARPGDTPASGPTAATQAGVAGRAAIPAESGAAALLLLRVRDLQGLNDRLGHRGADEALRRIALTLQQAAKAEGGVAVGRLNGSDFALAIDEPGRAARTAAALMRALRDGPLADTPGLQLAIGGVDEAGALPLPALLAAADAALAQAEAGAPFAVEVVAARAESARLDGAQAWRRGIEQALREGHARLQPRAVRTRDGELLYLACPLRLQLDPGGAFLPARDWLPLAARSRLLDRTDAFAVEQALRATESDGRARAVHLAAASLAAPGFVDRVHGLLQRHPKAARSLLLEVAEPGSESLVGVLREAAAVWRGSGVRIGVEVADGALQGRAWLQTVALAQLRIAGRAVAGLAGDAALQTYARSLATLAHGLGLRVVASGIDDAADLAAVWRLGFDGASGAAVDGGPGPQRDGAGAA